MTAIEQAKVSWQPGPQSPSLAEGEVHVWRADLDQPEWPSDDGLPADERARAARLSGRTAERWIASRWALRTVLGRYLDEDPATIRLQIGPHGKPALAEDPPRLRFNLSHSAELALVAICRDHEVGVDVERIRPRRNLIRIAERVLDSETAATIRCAPQQERLPVFHEAWTRHEAELKCREVGRLAQPPLTGLALYPLEPRYDYAAALAIFATRDGRGNRSSSCLLRCQVNVLRTFGINCETE